MEGCSLQLNKRVIKIVNAKAIKQTRTPDTKDVRERKTEVSGEHHSTFLALKKNCSQCQRKLNVLSAFSYRTFWDDRNFLLSVCSIWQPSAKCACGALKMWLSANEELNFKYDFISINLHLKSLVWLETSTLDSTILEPTFCTYSLCILFLDKWNKGSLESLPMF